MYIRSIFSHNWANIPDGIYEPGIMTLITGGNGSGKTTIGDAVQTVMTAARDKLFQYNPGQDESSQSSRKKTKRTLASYALGCDDGPYARPGGADTYIGINFAPNEGEKSEPFAAMVAVRARLSQEGAKQRPEEVKLELFIFPNQHIHLDDLKSATGSNWLSVEEELKATLTTRMGKGNVETFGNAKEQYLCRLYALFLGRERNSLPKNEMQQMVKSWVKFMAYKPVDNLDVFVRNSVLEPWDNKAVVEDIGSLMRQISEMRQQADHIEHSVDLIEKGLQQCRDLVMHWLKYQEDRAICARGMLEISRREYKGFRVQEDSLGRQITALDQTILQREAERKAIVEDLLGIRSKLEGHAEYRTKEDMEAQIEESETAIRDKVITVIHAQNRIEQVKQALLNLVSITDKPPKTGWMLSLSSLGTDIKVALNDIQSMGDVGIIKVDVFPTSEELQGLISECKFADESLDNLARVLSEPAGGGVSARERIAGARSNVKDELARVTGQGKGLEAEIAQLESQSKVSYDEDVNRALSEINRKLPGADPRVVGDHIEIVDPQWQRAIEGYLGGNKQAIVVGPEHEARAIKLVKDLKGRASVVQGEKARKDAAARLPVSDSIVQLMDFTDEYVRAYVEASYGNVVQVPDAETLRKTARGLTSDGMGSSGYRMYKCYESDRRLMCGKAAKEARRLALVQELDGINANIQRLNDEAGALLQLNSNLELIQPLGLRENLDLALEAAQKRETAKRILDTIDLSAVADLELRRDNMQVQLDSINEQLDHAKTDRGTCLGELYGRGGSGANPGEGSLKDRMQKLAKLVEEQEDESDLRTVQYVDWRREEEDFDEGKIIDLVESKGLGIDRATLKDYEVRLRKSGHLNRFSQEVQNVIADYNSTPVEQNRVENPLAMLDERTDPTTQALFKAAKQTRHLLSTLVQKLANNILVKRKATLTEAQSTFDETFTTGLVQEILTQIDHAQRTLKTLNNELVQHVFDDEYYEFGWSQHKEFGDYLGCFRKLRELSASRSGTSEQFLFESSELNDRDREILLSLKELLLQDNDANAANELARIADYRNYFDYEIYKVPEDKERIPLSTYGTGSGGQLETPFYVIMAAAFQSTMHFHEGVSHLRMVMIDESFSKLDEKRSRRILDYLAGKLGLQVIFIMPTSKSGPYKDIVTNQFVVQKVADTSPPAGSQLKTRVLVDQQVINKERVAELYSARRSQVTRQTEMDFMQAIAVAQAEQNAKKAGNV